MAVDSMVLDKVTLIPDQLLVFNKDETTALFEDLEYEDKDLTMFNIQFVDLVRRNVDRPEKGIMMRIVLKRKATTELMTTYLPTLLLLLLTFSGTFFRVELFGDAMAHNLTIMLVMTTIFTSKIEELPPTSDLKMVDIWLIFCQLIPFTEMVILTAIDYVRECVKKQREKNKETGKKKMIPALLRAIVEWERKTVSKSNSVASEHEENVSKVRELTAVNVEPLERKVINLNKNLFTFPG